MGFLVHLAIFAIATIARALLTPKVKRGKAPDLDLPLAEEGVPIPIVYGTQALAPVIMAVSASKHDGDREGTTIYEAQMVGALCHGPIDELVDIQFGGKSLRLHPFTKDDSSSADTTVLDPALPYVFEADAVPYVTIDVNARQLFGGDDEEGGVERHIRVHRGTLTDEVDAVVTQLWQAADLPGDGPAYPGVAYAVFGETDLRFYFGTVASPKPPVFIVRKIPNTLSLGPIKNDANPAEILYALKTSELEGAGADSTLIDTASFVTCGTTLLAEGLGLSCTFHEQDDIADMIHDVERHIQGGVYQDPVTGLWTMALARPDYVVANLEPVDRSVASDLVVTRPSWRETINEVKIVYRRYDDTPLNGAVIQDEQLTPDAGVSWFTYGDPRDPANQPRAAIYYTEGRDITAVSVFNVTKNAALVEGTHYRIYSASAGAIILYPVTGQLDAGDDLTVDYTNGSAFVGYREATAQDQDLANQQATQEVRSETYEYPFFSTEQNAQTHARRLLKLRGRPLAKATWTENRRAYARVPNDVVKLSWSATEGDGDFAISEVPFRITQVEYGTLEDGRVRVEAVEDVFGAAVLPLPPANSNNNPNTPPTAPAIAIGCGLGGAVVRIALFPSDTNFDIKVYRADDEDGTNATLIATLDGDTTYYDDPSGEGKSHAARLSRTGWQDGPLTDWITCEPEGPITDPTCVLPQWAISPDYTAGTLTVLVIDSQLRVQSVEFRTRVGTAAWSDWAEDTETPYSTSVTLGGDDDSRIGWRITYLNCAGDEVEVEDEVVFPADAEDPTPDPDDTGLAPTPFEIIGHRAGPLPWGFRSEVLTAEVSALGDQFIVEDWFDLTGVKWVRMTAMVHQTSVPAGATLAWQYTLDDGTTWDYLDAATGPQILVDTASLTADGVLRGDWVEVTEDARTDVRLRPVFYGGDETGTLILGGVALQGLAERPEVPPETPEEPPEIPPTPPTDPPPVGCNGTDEMPHFAKLKQWLIADCSEIITVGAIDRIDQINDQSGHGNHLTGYGISGNYALLGQTFGGDPVQLNGRDVAVFDAAYLLDPAGMMAGVTDATMSIVLKGLNGDPGGAVNYVYSWKLGGSSQQPIYAGNGNEIFGGGAAGHIYDDFGSDTRHNLGNPTPSLASWRVLTIRAADGVYKAYLDGALFFSGGANTVAWAVQGKLGNRGNNSKIAVAERSIHEGITEAQAMDVVATQGNRWGLTVGGGGSVGGDPGSGGDDGDNNGGGPDGDDPVPDPIPATGDRPYGMWALPSTGAGVWNCTIKVLAPAYAASLLDSAAANDMKIMCRVAGPESDWGKPFSYDKWKRGVDALAASSANTTLQAAITSGVAFCNYLIDEPNHPTRYGGPIPLATVERMAQYVKSIWGNNWPTVVRVSASSEWVTRHISGLDWLWSQYHRRRGEVVAWRNAEIAAAQSYNHGLVQGLNVIDFGGTGTGSGVIARWCNAAEYEYYGKKMCEPSPAFPNFRGVAFMCWQFQAAWYAQAGMAGAVERVSDYWSSFDP